jgi:hypothetical protein
MVYFLGRDVHASITTEHSFCGISILPQQQKVYVDNVLHGQVSEVTTGTDQIDCGAAHGLVTGDPVQITMDAATTPSAGLAVNRRYFAVYVDDDSLKLTDTYADAIAGSNIVNITDQANKTDMNITRELFGDSDSVYTAAAAAAGSNTHHTSIFNRNWPQYDGTGRVDTIGGDSTTPVPLKKTSTDKNVISDLTAIDVTVAKMDEDLALIGLRTGFKATVKNECTVVLTRKKTSPLFELLFNQARCGVMTYTNATDGIVDLDNATPLAATMKLPAHGAVQLNNSINATHTTPTRNFGYRMHIELKESSETMTLQNLCITDYAINITADGVTEETITLYGFVQPKIDAANGGYATATSADDL